MLTWSRAVLRAEGDPTSGPLKDIATLLSNQILLDPQALRGCGFHGMGWIQTQLPGVVGQLGENVVLLEKHELLILGDKQRPMITYHHQYNAPGYNGAISLLGV
ncbi:hypothetical protein RB601_005151 [Gaeumannomyces tritici]